MGKRILIGPQSNQRGIETSALMRSKACRARASIEPAWD
mgnify:CR=1 FL=1